MNEQITIKELFSLDKTIAAGIFEGAVYPWEVLSKIGDYIVELGNSLSQEEYYKRGDNIWIHKEATVFDSAYIAGPAIICKGAEVRHCAFIRGKAVVGENAVVGNSTELKNVILFDNVQVPHYNYMGAGSITSNVKSDKKLITIKGPDGNIDTGIKKIGAFLGDNVEIGCGSVLNPGTIIGRNSNIYPLSSVRGCIKSGSIYKNRAEVVEKY